MSPIPQARSTAPVIWLIAGLALLAAVWFAYKLLQSGGVSLMPAPRVDVLIQAGHENRSTGRTGAQSLLGREQDWTPIVASRAATVLEQAGYTVQRVDANLRGRDGRRASGKTRLALFIHFDGAMPPCSSGASIGISRDSDPVAAQQWRAFYQQYWPFGWMETNFTRNLANYYAYRWVDASDAELVLELGELTCAEQANWMQPRLEILGELIAAFAERRLCQPGGPGSPAPPLSPNCLAQ